MMNAQFTSRGRKLLMCIAVGIPASCAPKAVHTPANIAGPIPLTVANNQAPGDNICAILMLPPGPPKVDNLLGRTKLAPGGQADFSVAAATYRFAISNCEISGNQGNSQKGSYMSSIVGAIDPFEVSGPTYVSVGGPPVSPPPPGYTVKMLGTRVQKTAVCSAANDVCDANTNCCSGAPCGAAGRCP